MDALTQTLKATIQAADRAITAQDYDALMAFYTEDASLVVKPGLVATGKDSIRRAGMHGHLPRHVVTHRHRRTQTHHQKGNRLADNLAVTNHADIQTFHPQWQGFQDLHRRHRCAGAKGQIIVHDVAD